MHKYSANNIFNKIIKMLKLLLRRQHQESYHYNKGEDCGDNVEE